MSKRVELCKFDQIEDQGMRSFKIKGEKVVVCRIGDKVYAVENRCSHEDYPLEDGWIDKGRVCCSMHGAQFDPATGKALTLPAYEDIKAYPVKIIDDTIVVEIES